MGYLRISIDNDVHTNHGSYYRPKFYIIFYHLSCRLSFIKRLVW